MSRHTRVASRRVRENGKYIHGYREILSVEKLYESCIYMSKFKGLDLDGCPGGENIPELLKVSRKAGTGIQ